MGCDLGRPVKTRGPPHGQSGPAHVEPTSHESRPGPAHQICILSAAARPGPTFSKNPGPARPGPHPISQILGPAYHIFKNLGQARDKFQIGLARPGPARTIGP